ncbi:protein DBF4 B isoform X1 [Histomonas meleagridis]|uniref:protein DBF4-like B isoform X1 n=1 Tax=Histomonas meleagridis TaxID=135588 RepID=UPI00355A2D31|nr:protein DBF4 B isoform X1 [Histomonas meleagridis]KAH0807001.1 protein DBF4-like B isoform X1 [Histomonas meleagridis]
MKPIVFHKSPLEKLSQLSRRKTTQLNKQDLEQKKIHELSPNIFYGLKVRIALTNYIKKTLISNSLKSHGAIIISDDFKIDPDVVIVENAKNHKNNGKVKFVDFKQIPWVDKPIQDEQPFKGVVVVDSNHQRCPKFKEIDKLPDLYLQPLPNHHVLSPFIPPKDNIKPETSTSTTPTKKSSKPVIDHTNPPDCGYCEICMCNYIDAECHRSSKEHITKSERDDLFAELDELISDINSEYLLNKIEIYF